MNEIVGEDMILLGIQAYNLEVAVHVLYQKGKDGFYFSFNDGKDGGYVSGIYSNDDIELMRRSARKMIGEKYGSVHTGIRTLKEITIV